MYYGALKKNDIANGPGVRVSLFVSGCRNRCPGCFQPDTWAFDYGSPFMQETEAEILAALDSDHIQGFSLLGGEPFEPENQEALLPLLQKIRKAFPEKDVWCYTGYVYDRDLMPEDGRRHTAWTKPLLDCMDVLVDSPFVMDQKQLGLQFRGSSNQRVIDLAAMRRAGTGELLFCETRDRNP